MAEDHLAAPSPLPEHKKLAVFAGEWAGEEMVYPSRWTAGGPATSHVVARMDLNGFYLIQDTRQVRDGKEAIATIGPTNCSGTIRSATTRRRQRPAPGSATS